MTPYETAYGIVQKYSDMESDQTIGRASDLVHDIERVIAAYKREADRERSNHESWLDIQRRYQEERGFFARLFG